MPAGPYLEQALLNLSLNGTAFTPATTLYMGLSTTTISVVSGAISGITEPATADGYARVAVAASTTNWPLATGANPASTSNATQISFPTATTAAWGTAVATFFADAATGGNVYFYDTLAQPVDIGVGISPDVPIGDQTITLT